MRAIFISYRREDAEGQAGRLFDDLVGLFGNDSVFMDVAGIEPGRDFRRAIDQQVASCGVLLALIGKDWLEVKNESGQRRLDDPMDFVRLETASALKRDIPVIPVLVRGADMPRPEDLPADLKDLAFRNAVELTHARWDSDLQVLAKALTPYVETKPRSTPPELQSATASTLGQSRMSSARIIVPAAVVLIALAVGGYLWFGKSSQGAARQQEVKNNPTPEEPKNKPTPEESENKPSPEEPKNQPTATLSPRPIIRLHITPKILSPADGTVFGHYPRTVTLAWDRVTAAAGYKLEIEYQSAGRWSPLGQIRDTNTTTYTFNFVGAQPGRWRVWAVTADGNEGPKSDWSGFSFTR
jgi:hypothetical protein